MNKSRKQVLCDLLESRDAKVEETLRTLMSLGVTALSIGAPLLAVGDLAELPKVLIKAALLSAALGILSSTVYMSWRVRQRRYTVREMARQEVEDDLRECVSVAPRFLERISESFAYLFFLCALCLFVASCLVS